MYDGYIVCEEFADLVMDAWNQEQEVKVYTIPVCAYYQGYGARLFGYSQALHFGPAPALIVAYSTI